MLPSSAPPSARRAILRADALAASPLSLVVEEVVASVWMAPGAVGLTDVGALQRSRRPLAVLARRARVEVVGVDAPGGHAEVVQRGAGGDRADVQFIRPPVREHLLPLVPDLQGEVAVAVRTDRPVPQPAPIAAPELGFKPLSGIAWLRTCRHTTEYTEFSGRPS